MILASVLLSWLATVAAEPASPQGPGTRLKLPPIPEAVPKNQARFVGDYETALAEAKLRNCPVLYLLSDDSSIGFWNLWSAVLNQPAYHKMSLECIMVPAFDGKNHESENRKIEGYDTPWCKTFHVASLYSNNNQLLLRSFLTFVLPSMSRYRSAA